MNCQLARHFRLVCDLYTVTIGTQMITDKGRVVGPYTGQLLPKNMRVRFFVAATNVPQPYMARFLMKNNGEEARADKKLELKSTRQAATSRNGPSMPPIRARTGPRSTS